VTNETSLYSENQSLNIEGSYEKKKRERIEEQVNPRRHSGLGLRAPHDI